MAGTLAAQPRVRNSFWAIDSAGLVMAAALLTVKFMSEGQDFLAGGFLVFAIGEGVMLSGTAGTLVDSIPAFAAGTALWSVALLLISIPKAFVLWVRLIGIAAAFLFALTSAQIFWGKPLSPISSPLPFFAYPFIVAVFIGWIWTLLRDPQR